jgi:osmoprotectant transport system permease protein
MALIAYLALASMPGLWSAGLHALFPNEIRVLYQQASMLELIGRTLQLVAISSVLSVVIGVSLGMFVTHRAGADFHDVVVDLTNLGQTFPPVAVFTLAVPLLGFGVRPTVLALTLYGVLPVLQNTVAGMQVLPPAIVESAAGIGMSPNQSLWRVELPLASPVIMAGVRVSVVINVATSTIGAIAGAGGLGAPIISGLVNADPAVTLQGALLIGALALILDAYLGAIEKGVARSVGIKES